MSKIIEQVWGFPINLQSCKLCAYTYALTFLKLTVYKIQSESYAQNCVPVTQLYKYLSLQVYLDSLCLLLESIKNCLILHL